MILHQYNYCNFIVVFVFTTVIKFLKKVQTYNILNKLNITKFIPISYIKTIYNKLYEK